MEVSASKTNGLVDAAAGAKSKGNAGLASFASAAASFTSMVQNVGTKMQHQGTSPDIERARSDTVHRDQRDYDEPQARETQAVDHEPHQDDNVDHEPHQDDNDVMRDEPREMPRTETAPHHDAARDDSAPRDAADTGNQSANDGNDDHRNDSSASAPEQASASPQQANDAAQAENAQAGQAQVVAATAAAGVIAETTTSDTRGGRIAPVEAVIQSLQRGGPPTTTPDNAKAGEHQQAGQRAATDKGADGRANAQTQDGLLANTADKGETKAGGQANAQNAGANVNTHAKSGAAQGGSPQAQARADAPTTAQAQAGELAKVLNDPKARVQVNVTVNNEAETLTSKPSAALTATATGAAKGSKTAGTASPAQNTHTPGQAGAQQPGIAQQAAQPAQVLAQAAAGGNAQAAATSGTSAQATISTAGGEGVSATQAATPSGPAQQTQLPQQAVQAQRPATPHQAANQRAVVEQVSVQVSKAVNAGADKISIQLKPAALGRIDVQLEMQDGRIIATIVADSKDTLELLRNGSRDLAKSLNSAGFQADSQDLNFSLREEGNQNFAHGGKGQGGPAGLNEAAQGADGDEAGDMAADPALTNIIADGRVDIRA